MAPSKKSHTNGKSISTKTGDDNGSKLTTAESEKSNTGEETSSENKKRKATSQPSDAPAKAPRRSVRSTPATVSAEEQVKLLNYLLSPECLTQTRPRDEVKDLEAQGGDANFRTYSASAFTPLEELLSAMILSRPIGHMLGLRSIRTLFNPPHNLNTLHALRKAGYEGVRTALDEARTQHRQKTAEQLVNLAELLVGSEGVDENDSSLEHVRKASEHDPEKERELLQSKVKGLAKMGLDIFGRRIQGTWEEWYPFGDERSLQATEKLGLPGDAEELKKLVEGKWADLSVPDDLSGSDDEKKRKVFVRILERAVGAELEGDLDEVKSAALK